MDKMSFRIPDDVTLDRMLRQLSPSVIAKISAEFDADVNQARISHSVLNQSSDTFNIPMSTNLTENQNKSSHFDSEIMTNGSNLRKLRELGGTLFHLQTGSMIHTTNHPGNDSGDISKAA